MAQNISEIVFPQSITGGRDLENRIKINECDKGKIRFLRAPKRVHDLPNRDGNMICQSMLSNSSMFMTFLTGMET